MNDNLPALPPQPPDDNVQPPAAQNVSLARPDLDYIAKVATAPFSPEQIAVLTAPLEDDEVEIKPDGVVYFPEMAYRNRLRKAFGVGGWSLVPLHNPVVQEGLVLQPWCLVALGRFVAQATGAHQYNPSNRATDYGDSIEAAKSNALSRCCKDIGVAAELWNKTFILGWLKRMAVHVNAWNPSKNTWTPIWVRKDRPPPPPYTHVRPIADVKPAPGTAPAATRRAPAQRAAATPTTAPSHTQKALPAPARDLRAEMNAHFQAQDDNMELAPTNSRPLPPQSEPERAEYTILPPTPRQPKPVAPAPTPAPAPTKPLIPGFSAGMLEFLYTNKGATPDATTYSIRIGKDWHSTKDAALFAQAKAWKAAGSIVNIYWEERPFSGGLYRHITRMEEAASGNSQPPEAQPPTGVANDIPF